MTENDTIEHDRLCAIGERVSAATPGPWGHSAETVMDKPVLKEEQHSGGFTATTFDGEAFGIVTSDIDAANTENDIPFIAHARADVPWLLDLIAERDKEIADLKRAADA